MNAPMPTRTLWSSMVVETAAVNRAKVQLSDTRA